MEFVLCWAVGAVDTGREDSEGSPEAMFERIVVLK